MTDQTKAPVALQRPHQTTHHNRTLSDPWAWLRDPGYPDVKDPDVLAYLEAENAWFEAHMDTHKGLIDTLFEEMKGRIKEEDKSVPQKDGAYLYWSSFETGEQYRRHWRRPVGSPDDGSADQLILDERRWRKVWTISGSAPSPFPMTTGCSPTASTTVARSASLSASRTSRPARSCRT